MNGNLGRGPRGKEFSSHDEKFPSGLDDSGKADRRYKTNISLKQIVFWLIDREWEYVRYVDVPSSPGICPSGAYLSCHIWSQTARLIPLGRPKDHTPFAGIVLRKRLAVFACRGGVTR